MSNPPTVVLDPQLPPKERKLLERGARVLHPCTDPPSRPRFGGRTGLDLLFSLWQAPVWVHLPGLMGTFYSPRVRNAGLVAQAAVAGAFLWRWDLALVFFMVVGQPLAFLVLFARCGEHAIGRLARERHGRYLRSSDMGGEYLELFQRTVKAVGTVLESKVNEQGLLDEVRNTVTLPAQQWEVAQTLQELTRLSAQHRGAREDDPRVAALLKPQREALRLATRSVTERIRALEEYAAQTRAADEALEQWNLVQQLAASGDAYQELLARTVRDELAVAEIAGLTEQARIVEEALRASVDKARRAGMALVPETKAG